MLFDLLYLFQRVAVDFATGRKSAALFFEQGTGKTWVSAGIVERLCDEELEALIVVPLTNIETTWAKIFREKLPYINVTQDWDEFKKLAHPKILLRHYESLPSIEGKILRRMWSLIIYDESQRLKERGTRQSRIARKLRHKAHQKVILTGTPIEQSPQDLWGQFRFLAPEVLGDVWSDFDAEYLRPTGYMGYKREFRWTKFKHFMAKVEPYILRVKKEEVLDLPPMTIHRIPVTLIGRQRRIYQEMEKTFIATLSRRKKVAAQLKVTQIVKLQQITGGFLIENISLKEKIEHDIGQAKIRRLIPLVRRLRKPIVIFCKHREEIRRIQKAVRPLVNRLEVLHGGVRKNQRTGLLDDFQAGKISVLICQVKTGGVGIDLYRSSHAIIYSMGYSFIDYEQLLSRLHRHGQKKQVHIYWLYAKKSIDVDIYNAVLDKRTVSNAFHKRIRTERGKLIMARKKKTTSTKSTKAKNTKPEAAASEDMKYGVNELAKELGIKPASVRIKLRTAGVDKAGKSYGWNTKKEFDAVVKQLKSDD